MMIQKVILILMLILVAGTAQADYKLDNSQSRINFVSIKKDKIAETHTFKLISGDIAVDGTATVSIDLSSVETHIDIRNERMKTMLFETALFPSAVVSTSVDMSQLKRLQAGDMKSMQVELTINLHGKSKKMSTTLNVVKLSNGNMLVTTTTPILLNAFDFGLDSGIHALMEVAKLPSIATAVPVSFSLLFKSE